MRGDLDDGPRLGRYVLERRIASGGMAEVFRAGIESVHESQRAAARSLGLSQSQTMRGVVLPQAVRRVVPALMNDFVSLQKDVALVSVVGVVEALRRAQILQQKTYNFTPIVAAAVLFLCVSIPLTRFTDHLLARERRRTSGTVVS
jgi:polar amino acid transport system permease protein